MEQLRERMEKKGEPRQLARDDEKDKSRQRKKGFSSKREGKK